jgi:hypothetical protein
MHIVCSRQSYVSPFREREERESGIAPMQRTQCVHAACSAVTAVAALQQQPTHTLVHTAAHQALSSWKAQLVSFGDCPLNLRE